MSNTSTKQKRIVFDLDGCLCTQSEGDYRDAQPIPEAIATVNKLYNEGYVIIIYTARLMNRNQHNIHAVYEEGYEFTKQQLKDWGASCHMLIMGKPPADVVVDDRAVFFKNDWNLIEKEIKNKLGGA